MPGEASHATMGSISLASSRGHGMLYSALVAQHMHISDKSCMDTADPTIDVPPQSQPFQLRRRSLWSRWLSVSPSRCSSRRAGLCTAQRML